MNISIIERDIKNKEESLRRCKYNVECLCKSPRVAGYQEAIRLVSQEAFYLQDQLDQYYVLFNLLREDQPEYDEMLPRV